MVFLIVNVNVPSIVVHWFVFESLDHVSRHALRQYFPVSFFVKQGSDLSRFVENDAVVRRLNSPAFKAYSLFRCYLVCCLYFILRLQELCIKLGMLGTNLHNLARSGFDNASLKEFASSSTDLTLPSLQGKIAVQRSQEVS